MTGKCENSHEHFKPELCNVDENLVTILISGFAGIKSCQLVRDKGSARTIAVFQGTGGISLL